LVIDPVTTTEPDPGHPSASPLFQLALTGAQLVTTDALSNPPSFRPFALLAMRHTQALFEQLNVPEGQSETLEHCLQVPLTQIGVVPLHIPHE
jgi:hypothetical protein